MPGMPGEYVYQSMTACEADFWGNGRGLWSGFGFRDGLECWKKFNCCKGRTNISLPSHIHHEGFGEKLEDFIFFFCMNGFGTACTPVIAILVGI